MAQTTATSNDGTIFPGRYTAGGDREFVLFIIGMRFNGWRDLSTALRVASKMPTMLAELERDKPLGLLASNTWLSWPVLGVTQYWRSFEDLERYAAAPELSHSPVWRWYNKLGRSRLGGGIFHETYRIAPGTYETIYANMPRFGLAKATDHRAIDAASRARTRMADRRSSRAEDGTSLT